MPTKPKRVAIVQSCYIPWKGYFDLIRSVDEFIFYDDVQYTKHDWRNRNQIKTQHGLLWLTVPVSVNGKFGQTIREAQIENKPWAEKHLRTILQSYARAPYYKEVAELISPYYTTMSHSSISDLNRRLTQAICDYLNINTKLSCSWDYNYSEGKTERLVSLCSQTGATEYISGPSARSYIIPELFEDAGIKLTWFDYTGYPEYPQLWGDFVHNVSIVDLLFNCGRDAVRYIKSCQHTL